VLNLYLEKPGRIRDPLVKSMKSFELLREYARASEDLELSMLIDIVTEYGSSIPALLKKLKALHVPDEQRHTADMFFSTLHRSKGMEYDAVTLTDDFITPERLKRQVIKEQQEPIGRDRLNEEINLAYVAVTRSRGFLDFPMAMFPHEDRSLFTEKTAGGKLRQGICRALFLHEKRKHHPNAYKPWTLILDRELRELYSSGRKIKDLERHFGRDAGAIRSRLKKLGRLS
jgi:F-box protein 18 (helicase)